MPAALTMFSGSVNAPGADIAMAESDTHDMEMAFDIPMKPVSTDVLKNMLTFETETEDAPAVTARDHTPRASDD